MKHRNEIQVDLLQNKRFSISYHCVCVCVVCVCVHVSASLPHLCLVYLHHVCMCINTCVVCVCLYLHQSVHYVYGYKCMYFTCLPHLYQSVRYVQV